MTKFILACLFSLLISVCFAWDYDIIPINSASIWEASSRNTDQKNVISLRVDSSALKGTDTACYLIRNIQPIALEGHHDCVDALGASLIGRTYFKGGNQIRLENYEGDTIKIDFVLKDGDSSICYVKKDTVVFLTLDSTFLGSALGMADSIKTYSFSLQIGGAFTSSYLDTMKLALSKNYGAISLFNMYYFPVPPSYFDYPQSNIWDLDGLMYRATATHQFTLKGLTSATLKLGIQNLDFETLHNGFEVGDEWHRFSEKRCNCTDLNGSKSIDKVIAKNKVNGVYSYTIDRIVNSWQWPNDPSMYTHSRDTLIFAPYDDHAIDELNRLPYESNGTETELLVLSSQVDSIEKKIQGYLYLPSWDNTGVFCQATGSAPSLSTYHLCHLIPKHESEYIGGDEVSNEVLYYKTKKCGEWGNKQVLNTPFIGVKNQTALYPNPSQGNFKVISRDVIEAVTIYDQSGSLVKTTNPSNDQKSIEVQLDKSGVYFVHVQSESSTQVLKAVLVK